MERLAQSIVLAVVLATACTRTTRPADLPAPPPAPPPAIVEEPLPPHWRGAFTMVEVPTGTTATRQFTLVLGRDGPNSFTARRGCYSRAGRLLRRGAVWLVETDGDAHADAECLRRGLGAPGFPQALFEHRAIAFSPPGGHRWIAENGLRWTYLQNPSAPPTPAARD